MSKKYSLTNFQKKGFEICKFKNSETFRHFKKTLLEVEQKKIKDEKWFLESKYPGTEDLRPDVNSYDECFIDLLIENDIPEKINFLTQRELGLAHIQVRVSSPGESYMPWHKDTYSFVEKDAGLFPAPIKLIYYLPDDKKTETKLQIIEGSHRCQMSNLPLKYQISPGFNIFDRDVVVKNLQCVNFNNEDYNFILFDTSCLHNVVKTDSTSTRVIYTFCTEFQFNNSFGSIENKNRENHIKTFNDFKVKNGKRN